MAHFVEPHLIEMSAPYSRKSYKPTLLSTKNWGEKTCIVGNHKFILFLIIVENDMYYAFNSEMPREFTFFFFIVEKMTIGLKGDLV